MRNRSILEEAVDILAESFILVEEIRKKAISIGTEQNAVDIRILAQDLKSKIHDASFQLRCMMLEKDKEVS